MRRLLLVSALVLAVCADTPARAEGESTQTSPQSELAEVCALRVQGGHLAVHRLLVLLRQGGPEVRLAAIDALGRVGLRSEGAASAVRRALETTNLAERRTALRVLGRLGDSRDLEALLGAIHEDDAGLRATAVQGLRDLTGRRLPVSPTRCALWWRSSAKGLRQAVQAALEAVPAAESERHVQAAVETLVRDGWVDLVAVTEAARAWLRDSDHGLRAAGFQVAAALRLADLASAVESALPFVSEVDAEQGAAAARALGVDLDLLPPYWRKRLEDER